MYANLNKSNIENEASELAPGLAAEMDSLWVFLDEHGVPTNNKQAFRFGVLWRERSLGSQVERIFYIKETF